MNYCNRVDRFINYTLSNPKNISEGSIRYPFKRCKNKKFLDLDVVTIYLLQKEFMKKYLCQFVYGEPYVSYEIMVERIVNSTFSSNNMHEVIDDNSNHYKSIAMDAMRMNQDYICECSSVDEN